MIDASKYKWYWFRGDALTPARMWDWTFLTDEEYSRLHPLDQKAYKQIDKMASDYLESHINSLIESEMK